MSQKRLHAVQLGFSVDLEDDESRMLVAHHSQNWRDWDGGQIGGRPSWLQPRDLPTEFLACRNCDEPLCFLCQLYAPADEVNPNAFHRSLYVFGCPSQACSKEPMGSIRVLRAQLPRQNDFYPEEKDETWAMHLPEAWDVGGDASSKAWDVELCRVCGQRGKGKCPIQGYHFCGKHHQREHKKFIFDKLQTLSKQLDLTFLPSVCAESELVVEEEPGNPEQSEEEMAKKADKVLFPDGNEKDDNEDKDLEQEDLNAMTGAAADNVSTDPVTMAFYDRVKGKENVQEQVLRYLRWPQEDGSMEASMPLWIKTEHQPDKIPECSCCGAERKFEFQLMPQMLHYLLKDHEIHRARSEIRDSFRTTEVKEAIQTASSIMEQAPAEQIPPDFADAKEKAVSAIRSKLMGETGDKELSWGVVAVYTCTASCDGEKAEA
eukprot:CAMPEP_0117000018 /NCGR_PEP_ID=MMETSP0472-20121206/2511_1 /TAXON_ID=693140 ORGANISM="Tiarina fusus, Strain LIS" /NCGR_SAMPLE_ID=MMETSP0472 /ASSEMBLY_ACC=CAM_ASM_000603 /LENGTH=431 /DNA_ID=CAMNT_0004699593 /DNA_START=52 /DNA_END=1345 /DNA_ORIENTATION=-